MRIVVVGATGTIGKAVVAALQDRHEIVKVGNRGGDHQVDITDSNSIRALFEKTGRFDALVSAAGKVHFGDFAKLTEKEVEIGLHNKLMGEYFRGHEPVPGSRVANAYVKSVEGRLTGQVFHVL